MAQKIIDLEQSGGHHAPDLALLFYGESGLSTVHAIQNSFSSEPEIGPGRLLERGDVRALARIFDEQTAARPNYILPDRVLGAGDGFLTWYHPAHKRKMHFFVGSEAYSPDVIWPSLIFHATGSSLFLVSYAGSERPGAGTKIWHAPLMNIHDNTELCRGSGIYPSYHDPSTIPGWERAVFDTAFTHINQSVKLAGRENSDEAHLAFWLHPARSRYPVSERHLVDLRGIQTCEEWLTALHIDEW